MSTLKERLISLNISLNNSGRTDAAFLHLCKWLADKSSDQPRWLEQLVEELEAWEANSK